MTQCYLNFLKFQKLGGVEPSTHPDRYISGCDKVYGCLIYRERNSLRFNGSDLRSSLQTKNLVTKESKIPGKEMIFEYVHHCCLRYFFVYFILSRVLYRAFSANLDLLCMPQPGMGPLV